MRDPRALANTKNLDSYRAWQREGLGWSGLNKAVLVSALSVPAFAYAATLIEHVTRGDPGALVRLMGAAMAAYLVGVGVSPGHVLNQRGGVGERRHGQGADQDGLVEP